jgi:hypothetical protein
VHSLCRLLFVLVDEKNHHLGGAIAKKMNGTKASSAAHHPPQSTSTPPPQQQQQQHDYKASDCSFYLNLVVLDHLVVAVNNKEQQQQQQQHHGDGSLPPPSKQSSENAPSSDDELHLEEDNVHDDDNDVNGETAEPQDGETNEPKDAEEARTEAKKVLLRAASTGSSSSSCTSGAAGLFKKSLQGLESKTNSLGGKAFSMGKALHGVDKSLRNSMHGLTKASSQVATKAGAFAARKTMVNRAQITLNKCLPEIASLYSADDFLTIGRRFSQGKVTVLHVVLKPLAMSRYLSDIIAIDDENQNVEAAISTPSTTTTTTTTTTTSAADQYSSAMSTLQALNATETMKCLEREMLEQVRKRLMQKLSTVLLQKMNEMESGLELECIALEEAEEARWLFTFMEFQAQMQS